jgi:hypothetical protein
LLNCGFRSSFVVGIFNSELFFSELWVSFGLDEDTEVEDDVAEVEVEDDDVEDDVAGVEVEDDVAGVEVDDELIESSELDIFFGSILDFVESLEDVEDSTISNFFFCGLTDIILIY